MNTFIVLACCLAAVNAGVISSPYAAGTFGAPFGYAGYAAAPALAVAPGLTSTQYHAQDELGQYSYGYAGGPSSKSETKTADGITRGSYSYVDAHGLLQTANYISDPVNGFRVSRTDLPVGPAPVAAAFPVATYAAAPAYAAYVHGAPLPVDDTPEVKLAKAQHFQAHAEAAARAAL